MSSNGIAVSPGMAIDSSGHEIVLTEQRILSLEPLEAARRWERDLVITWHEVPENPMPGPLDTVQFTRWIEQPELTLVVPGEAAPEAVTLARLTQRSRGAVDVDTSSRQSIGTGQQSCD